MASTAHDDSRQSGLVAMLAEARLFAGLPEADLAAAASAMRPVTFASGKHIFARGDEGRELYLVTRGRVRLSILTLEGRELSFTHAVEGDVFGEIAMLDGGSRTADATAVTKVEAMALGREALRDLMESNPAVCQAAIRFLCARLRDADMQLEGVALHRIEVRLARFLLGMASQRATDDDEITVDMGMSQGELALLLGASRPKVNGALVALEDQGAITRSESRIVCRLELLRDIAEV